MEKQVFLELRGKTPHDAPSKAPLLHSPRHFFADLQSRKAKGNITLRVSLVLS